VIEIKGKVGISAKVICDSISPQGNRITTFELNYPRIIHSELLTHCILARNSASSRAIPFKKMVEQLGARPVRLGAANKGMQDTGVDHDELVVFVQPNDGYESYTRKESSAVAWQEAQDRAVEMAEAFYEAGYHKQVYNRLIEPFQFMKTVMTATEWNNFFYLRVDGAADPTIDELARCMKEAREQSEPLLIHAGEYHLPYVHRERDDGGTMRYFIDETLKGIGCQELDLDLETAIKVSCARTCAVSFRNVDYGVEKCRDVYDNKLLGQDKIHGSALEHVATPMEEGHYSYDCHTDGLDPWNSINVPSEPRSWQEGITHVDRKGNLWSAKFKNWIQHRKTIAGENFEG
jgi:hypothetical protein